MVNVSQPIYESRNARMLKLFIKRQTILCDTGKIK